MTWFMFTTICQLLLIATSDPPDPDAHMNNPGCEAGAS